MACDIWNKVHHCNVEKDDFIHRTWISAQGEIDSQVVG